ncbi:Signal peptidase complex subunit 1 [Colletotrichum fructicola]|nr:Signal peptidase complex subunit 1 [Colletotrichum fructicola]
MAPTLLLRTGILVANYTQRTPPDSLLHAFLDRPSILQHLVRDLAEGQIDFEGQKLADLLATLVLSASGALAFLVGFFLQDIKLAVYIGLAGTALTFLLVVPPWPFYKRHPVKWLESNGTGIRNVATIEKSG